MKVDESGAPWPYDDVLPTPPPTGLPTWECPGGLCVCHPVGASTEPVDHSIVFFDELAKKMPRARCRVLENGKLINKDSPYAGGDGALNVKILPTTRTLEVAWAPENAPEEAQYPFRRLYYVELDPNKECSVERRLCNIGFSAYFTLEDNVKDFQRAYVESDTQSGDPDDISSTLRGYHDAATLPPLGTQKASMSTSDDAAETARASQTGQSSSGSVAGIKRPVLKIQLIELFTLKAEDIHAPKKKAVDSTSDPAALVKQYYPEGRIKTRGTQLRVQAASLTFYFDSTKKSTVQTNRAGEAIIDLTGAKGSKKLRVVVVPPNEDDLTPARRPSGGKKRIQLNSTNKPAGPAMTDENTSLGRLYRAFAVEIELDDQGLVPLDTKTKPPKPEASKIKVISSTAPKPNDSTGDVDPDQVKDATAAKPPYVKLADATLLPAPDKDTPLVVIDWRPDWIKGSTEGKERKPWNRFRKGTVAKEAPLPAVLIHSTHGMMLGSTIAEWLPANSERGAHYIVDLDGHAVKVVDEYYMSWHAGNSQWDNHNAVNQFSVGIETLHSDFTPPGVDPPASKYTPRDYTQEQYDTWIRLLRELMKEYGIDARNVVGHRDIHVAGAKSGKYPDTRYQNRMLGAKPWCPGMSLQWDVLEEAGVALAPTTKARFSDAAYRLYQAAPMELNDKNKLEQVVKPSAGLTADDIRNDLRLLKQMLFDIGYSVSRDDPAPPRTHFAGVLDDALVAAVKTFQSHHFSGTKRAYAETRIDASDKTRTSTLDNAPKLGYIDTATIKAIIETWWASEAAKAAAP